MKITVSSGRTLALSPRSQGIQRPPRRPPLFKGCIERIDKVESVCTQLAAGESIAYVRGGVVP